MRNPYDNRTRVKYVVCESPQPQNETTKRYLHTRIASKGTIRLDSMTTLVSGFTSFSSSDIKGILDAFINQLVLHLEGGYEVDFEGLGHFSATLQCRKKVTDASKIIANDVSFKSVKFRCSKEIRKRLSSMCFERVPKEEQYTRLSANTRKKRILSLFEKYKAIQSGNCMAKNGCSRHMAQKDLKELLQEGKIVRVGSFRSVMYVLPE